MRDTCLGAAALAWTFFLLVGCTSHQAAPQQGELAGTVRDTVADQAVANADVQLAPGGQHIVTDSAGTFAFHRLEPGIYRLTASKDGYESPDPVSIRVEGGKSADAALALVPSLGHIVGTVTDADTGTAIAGATVATDPASAEAVTDSDGRYVLGVSPGTFAVQASAAAYVSTASGPVEVSAGGSVTVDLSLSAAITYDSTCESCHLQLAALVASLESDPIPDAPPAGGSAGEG